ncbi:MAG: patatin-like phospholipase family protein [Anaerolineae bacterium]
MIAFVLSGGGNRGALQVGALQALFERGIAPDILVGTSAGAVNAAYIATKPSLEGAQELAEIWQGLTKEDVYPGNWLTILWRIITRRDSLFPNANFLRFIEIHAPSGVERFGDITSVRLYIVATRLDTGEMRLFGEDPEECLLDALMASTALPPLLPPWRCEGKLYIDGGTVADLPVTIALEKGAKEIYALHVAKEQVAQPIRGLINVARQALTDILRQQMKQELERTMEQPRVKLHHIQLTAGQDLPFWDFSHASELIEEGRRATEAYLKAQPSSPPHGQRVWRLVKGLLLRRRDSRKAA